MASTGQAASQAPQEIHLSASISYLSSPSAMASLGQVSAQLPHLMHSSLILYAIGTAPPCLGRVSRTKQDGNKNAFIFLRSYGRSSTLHLHCITFFFKCKHFFKVICDYFAIKIGLHKNLPIRYAHITHILLTSQYTVQFTFLFANQYIIAYIIIYSCFSDSRRPSNAFKRHHSLPF